MTDDPLDLDALEVLHAAGTPLPWFVEHPFSRRIIRGPETGYGPAQVARCNVERSAVAEVDAALIAAAVNALPGLVAEIRRLRAIETAARDFVGARGCVVDPPCGGCRWCGLAKELEAR